MTQQIGSVLRGVTTVAENSVEHQKIYTILAR